MPNVAPVIDWYQRWLHKCLARGSWTWMQQVFLNPRNFTAATRTQTEP